MFLSISTCHCFNRFFGPSFWYCHCCGFSLVFISRLLTAELDRSLLGGITRALSLSQNAVWAQTALAWHSHIAHRNSLKVLPPSMTVEPARGIDVFDEAQASDEQVRHQLHNFHNVLACIKPRACHRLQSAIRGLRFPSQPLRSLEASRRLLDEMPCYA